MCATLPISLTDSLDPLPLMPPETVETNPAASERERLELEVELKAERDTLREYYSLALSLPEVIDATWKSMVEKIPTECGGWNEHSD